MQKKNGNSNTWKGIGKKGAKNQAMRGKKTDASTGGTAFGNVRKRKKKKIMKEVNPNKGTPANKGRLNGCENDLCNKHTRQQSQNWGGVEISFGGSLRGL